MKENRIEKLLEKIHQMKIEAGILNSEGLNIRKESKKRVSK